MKYWILISVGVLLGSCSNDKNEDSTPSTESVVNHDKPKYTYKVFHKPDLGWCYQVFRGPKIIIDQQHIPAVQGIHGFETKEQAEIAVNFVMERVLAGNERPSVTPQELDSIGAIDLKALQSIDAVEPIEFEPPTEKAIDQPVREKEYQEM